MSDSAPPYRPGEAPVKRVTLPPIIAPEAEEIYRQERQYTYQKVLATGKRPDNTIKTTDRNNLNSRVSGNRPNPAAKLTTRSISTANSVPPDNKKTENRQKNINLTNLDQPSQKTENLSANDKHKLSDSENDSEFAQDNLIVNNPVTASGIPSNLIARQVNAAHAANLVVPGKRTQIQLDINNPDLEAEINASYANALDNAIENHPQEFAAPVVPLSLRFPAGFRLFLARCTFIVIVAFLIVGIYYLKPNIITDQIIPAVYALTPTSQELPLPDSEMIQKLEEDKKRQEQLQLAEKQVKIEQTVKQKQLETLQAQEAEAAREKAREEARKKQQQADEKKRKQDQSRENERIAKEELKQKMLMAQQLRAGTVPQVTNASDNTINSVNRNMTAAVNNTDNNLVNPDKSTDTINPVGSSLATKPAAITDNPPKNTVNSSENPTAALAAAVKAANAARNKVGAINSDKTAAIENLPSKASESSPETATNTVANNTVPEKPATAVTARSESPLDAPERDINSALTAPVPNANVIVYAKSRIILVRSGNNNQRVFRNALVELDTSKKRSDEWDVNPPIGVYSLHKSEEAGVKFFAVSYPGRQDAESALLEKKITQQQHDSIIDALTNNRLPPSNTPLGTRVNLRQKRLNENFSTGDLAVSAEILDELCLALGPITPVAIVNQ